MPPHSRTSQDPQDDGKQLRTITSIFPITEEGNRDDVQRPEHGTDDLSIERSDIQVTGQQPETTEGAPTGSAESSPPAKTSPANSISKRSTISPLGRPPQSLRHYYLKEMWPGQPICHLCHREYKKTNRAIRALPCGDIFHRTCIDHLLAQKDGRCPSCESSIPIEWYLPHKYDPTKPAGSSCLCHPAPKAGTTTKTDAKNEGSSSSSQCILAIQKACKRTKEAVIRYIPGRKPKKVYASFKTETGQTRYIESETGAALPDPSLGNATGEYDRASCQ